MEIYDTNPGDLQGFDLELLLGDDKRIFGAGFCDVEGWPENPTAGHSLLVEWDREAYEERGEALEIAHWVEFKDAPAIVTDVVAGMLNDHLTKQYNANGWPPDETDELNREFVRDSMGGMR